MRADFASLGNVAWYLTKYGYPMQIDGTRTFLVGVDGWADGYYGDYENSPVVLNDSRLIADLWETFKMGFGGISKPEKQRLLTKMRELAQDDATQLAEYLKQIPRICSLSAVGTYDDTLSLPTKVVILTHVPPFPECSLYKGKIANMDYLPFYTSKLIGDEILAFAKSRPETEVLVLCGHSHHSALFKPLPNLTIKTGAAEYYHPAIQEVFDIGLLSDNMHLPK
jgi:hypothetical protein